MTQNSTSTLPMRRRHDSLQAAGRREVDAPITPIRDVSVRELVVAGGLRGLTVREMFA